MRKKAFNNMMALILQIRRPVWASFMAIMILLILLYSIKGQVRTLNMSLYHQDSHQIYETMSVEEGDTIIYKWIHSFEKIPWIEYYQIQGDGKLKLYRIEVAGFGAGIPENKGEMHVEDGLVIMTNFEELYDDINWIHSNTALCQIVVSDVNIIEGKSLPHHEPLTLKIVGRLIH